MAYDLPEQNSFEPKNFFLENKISLAALSIFFTGLFFLAIGTGLYLFKNQEGSGDIQIISTESTANPNIPEIMVHVDGAVKNPGLYKLPSTARVNDVVLAAGGLSTDANSNKLNLAAKVSDGQKIHVVSINDTGSSGSSSNDPVSLGLININTSTAAELDKLPRVGEVTAQKIIAGRPYSSIEELVSKKIVSSSVFEQIKGLISY